ncbi:MAG TPA: HDOD domain-containing protein [Rhodocyclaceae bacterium]
MGRQLDCRVINYQNIPVKSDVIAGIMRLDVESDTCFRELDNYVCSDLGVATLVLRVVNSAFYSKGNHIANIPKAISVLGFNVVRSLAMLAFSRSLFALTRNPLFQRHIWQHSLLTALAGQLICSELGDANDRDEAFIAGLMHDMGKVLLFNHSQHRYLEVLSLVVNKGMTSIEAEQRIFGGDHIAVGREAVSQWKLPQRFLDFMGRDLSVPDPESAGDAVLASLAGANYLARSSGFGAVPETDLSTRAAKLAAFGLDAARCRAWAQESFMTGLTENETYKLCANL